MGLREDLDRFYEVGEENREDLSDFVKYGDLSRGSSDEAHIPIKIIDLPEFQYDQRDKGGVGQGDAEVGDPVGQPQPGDGEEGEPGEEGGEHEYYEMDPEEFAEEMDEELGLDLDPKGKKVVEETEGAYKEVARQGANLDQEYLIKEGIKRGMALAKDDDYLREVLKIDGWDPEKAFEWARVEENIPVGRKWLQDAYADLEESDDDVDEWDDIDELIEEHGEYPSQGRLYRRNPKKNTRLRTDDERYRHPEIEEEYEKSAVIVNIRDVSGSMREDKRELVERTFVPMDWYLQGKYDNAEFIYIAHDADAWEVDREEFFGIRSGGGTKISSAYEMAEHLLEEYPWSDWNRYVFAAGDSENSGNDTKENVIPMMENIPANLHAYVETQPGKDEIGQGSGATHAEDLLEHKNEKGIDDWVVTHVGSSKDALNAIEEILSTESEE